MRRLQALARAVALTAIALALGGCGVAASSAAPSGASTSVTSADEAMRAVRARSPLFDGIQRKDANLIGQGSWWDAAQGTDGWLVTVEVGWADCQAGCIDRHTWAWT